MQEAIFCKGKTVCWRAIFCELTGGLTCIDRYSILPAITLDGIIECTIIEGSFNTELFTEFIEDLLEKMQPFPANNSVVVMDNCKIHKAPEIRDLIEGRYFIIICLVLA